MTSSPIVLALGELALCDAKGGLYGGHSVSRVWLISLLVLLFCGIAWGQTAAEVEALRVQAKALYTQQNWKEALPVAERALKAALAVHGKEDATTSYCAWLLGAAYQGLGEYSEAEAYLKFCVIVDAKRLGPEHPETATSIDKLAGLYEERGDYQAALPLYQRSLATFEKAYGPEHPSTATSLNNLAGLYAKMEDWQSAQRLFERSLAIYEKAFGLQHSFTAIGLNNLAGLYAKKGDHAAALELYQRSLPIIESVQGPEHPATAAVLNNLASLYQSTGNAQAALSLYKRCLTILETSHGPQSLSVAQILNGLARVYESTGDYRAAMPLYERSLSILEKVSGPEHRNTAAALESLALLHLHRGDRPLALALARKSAEARLAVTSNIFTFASERQRLSYQESHYPYSLFGTIASAGDLSQAALRYKGLVLESVVEDLRLAEASEDIATRELATRVKSVKGRLNKLALETSANPSGEELDVRQAELAELKQQLEALQGQLARYGVEQGNLRQAFTVTPSQVQQAMPEDSVLVEYLRYRHHLGKRNWETRYGALLLPPKGEVKWVPLADSAEELEREIGAYKALVRGLKDGRFVIASEAEDLRDTVPSSLLTKLHSKIWDPIEGELPAGTKTVIISPDGDLNFLSLATILTPEGTFLAEKYNITYVSSGRDLVARIVASDSKTQFLVGDPDFGSAVESDDQGTTLSRAVATEDWQQLNFSALPYTRSECESLSKLLQRGNREVTMLLREQASERSVRAVQAPETLHLATHGYFLPQAESKREAQVRAKLGGGQKPTPAFRDPMLRSGLALAGAQTTVDLRAKGESPDMKNDGLLTAAEVGLLNLKGTKLVTLSACDTGSGESRAGEGVLGLRRGFVLAGARNLVLTLWPVADKETSELMQEFYARAESRPAPIAMAEVQREWLTRLRRERSIRDAVRLAGPFVVSFQGKLE